MWKDKRKPSSHSQTLGSSSGISIQGKLPIGEQAWYWDTRCHTPQEDQWSLPWSHKQPLERQTRKLVPVGQGQQTQPTHTTSIGKPEE